MTMKRQRPDYERWTLKAKFTEDVRDLFGSAVADKIEFGGDLYDSDCYWSLLIQWPKQDPKDSDYKNAVDWGRGYNNDRALSRFNERVEQFGQPVRVTASVAFSM